MVKWKISFWKFYGRHHALVNRYKIYVSRLCYPCRTHNYALSSYMTYHGCLIGVTRRIPLVEQKLLILPEHLNLPTRFNAVQLHVFMFFVPCYNVRVHLYTPLFCMRLFVYVICIKFGVQHDFPITLCSFRLTVRRRVILVNQDLLTLLEHMSSSPAFCGFRVAQYLFVCVVYIIVCLLFLLATVFSVLLLLATVLSVLLLLATVFSVLLLLATVFSVLLLLATVFAVLRCTTSGYPLVSSNHSYMTD